MSERFAFADFAHDLAHSIALLQEHAPTGGEPYYGCFSGGKDSVVLRAVASLAGVRVQWHYNVTTIDPPQLVRFIRHAYPDVARIPPRHGPMLRYAAEVRGPPTRRARWCCGEYKETPTPRAATVIMGIRAQESPARAKRWGYVTTHTRSGARVVCPILHWDVEDLWGFVRRHNVSYSPLYDEGWTRLGCIGCPMASYRMRAREFSRWPYMERGWQTVIRRTWERRHGTLQRDGRPWFGDAFFSSWEGMWDWWLHDIPLPRRSAQMDLEYEEREYNDE